MVLEKREIMKTTKIIHKTGVENTALPKYNPFQTGHGEMKSKKYPNRGARKQGLKKEVCKYGL